MRRWFALTVIATMGPLGAARAEVSYYRDVRPVLQRSCSGCHQPANTMSALLLTEFAGIQKGGVKHGPAVRPGEPEASPIVAYLTGKFEPRMPMGGDPLPQDEIELIQQWIAGGAVDDTPESARRAAEIPSEPPLYRQPPVITGLAYSPDGKWLAVGGYKEILLHQLDAEAPPQRLLGRSDKIHSLEFTPDGSRLVAVGGVPARFGEVQVWDVKNRELERSVLSTSDTLFDGDLSPDGKRVVFGGADKTVRAIDLASGEELFKAGHHEDWVLDAAFGVDGKRIVSVGRDRAAKLAKGDDGAFLENVNLLRDMLYAIERHPRRDYVLVGGEDRVPYLYMMDRPRALKIADDSTLVRKYEEQQGPILALAFSPDGGRFAVGGISPEVPVYETGTGRRVAACKGHEGGIFTLAFHPDGKQLAAAGFDGQVRLYDPATGELLKEFIPVPIEERSVAE